MVTGNTKAEAFYSMKELLKETGGYAIIDGGLATELERHGADLNDPLWSAKCLLTSPHLIHTVNTITSLSLSFFFSLSESNVLLASYKSIQLLE